MTDLVRITAFLKSFGCNSREALTYLEAVKTGPTSVQELARKLKRNRIAVHYTVQQLIKKGLLFETRKGKKRLIAAEDSNILSRIIDQRYSELKNMETHLGYVTKLLNSIQIVNPENTIVKFYDDIEGFKKMLEETLLAQGELLIFSSMDFFSQILGEEYLGNYFMRRAQHNIHTKMIYPPCAFADKIAPKKDQFKIDLRILPQDQRSGSGLYIWNNTVALKALKENGKSCTIIENRDIAHFFRNNIFNHFWEEAKPYEKL